MRTDVFCEGMNSYGLVLMSEYILKMMANHPGLNQERIIAQLTREYGEGLPEKLAISDQLAKKEGLKPGVTALEDMSKCMAGALPKIAELHPKVFPRRCHG